MTQQILKKLQQQEKEIKSLIKEKVKEKSFIFNDYFYEVSHGREFELCIKKEPIAFGEVEEDARLLSEKEIKALIDKLLTEILTSIKIIQEINEKPHPISDSTLTETDATVSTRTSVESLSIPSDDILFRLQHDETLNRLIADYRETEKRLKQEENTASKNNYGNHPVQKSHADNKKKTAIGYVPTVGNIISASGDGASSRKRENSSDSNDSNNSSPSPSRKKPFWSLFFSPKAARQGCGERIAIKPGNLLPVLRG